MSSRRKSKASQRSGNPTKRSKTIDLGWKEESSSGVHDDEDIHSDGSDVEREHQEPGLESEEIEEEETVDAKKVRLAREYLRKLEENQEDESSSSERDGSSSEGEDENDRLSYKLQRERLKREGALQQEVADRVQESIANVQASVGRFAESKQNFDAWVAAGHTKLLRGHDLSPTCVGLQANGERAISGSKDHSVIIWDVEQEKKSAVLCGHWKGETDSSKAARTLGEVLSVAVSDDNRYAAVGRRDATVCIYDIRSGKENCLVKEFTGHKGAVTSLSFRPQSLQLFSGSEDRCIRHYNVQEMMYIETLYGHQFGVTGIDCCRKERPISVGRDRTARVWKLSEDTHLIFRGGAKIASPECISSIKDDWFLTGHEDGHIGLWMTDKKKAVSNFEFAHGKSHGSVGRSISSITSLKGSDIAASGSNDGSIKLWKVMTGSTVDERGLESLADVPVNGFVNGIAIGPEARFCVAAIAQEPRLGRWDRVPNAKNRFGIIKLR